MAWQTKFWSLVILLCLLPLINSTFHNLISLTQNIAVNIRLQQEKKFLEKDKKHFANKLEECDSQSGIKRAIKEEISLVENNEILVKIVEQ